MPTNFTIADAKEISPKRVLNRIVRQINNLDDDRSYLMNNAFPLMQMGDSEAFYQQQRGLRSAMPGSSLVSESPVAGLEELEQDNVDISTLKEKISPEKALGAELNSQQEILDVAQYVSDALMTDAMNARSLMAWQGYNNTDGMIGKDGLTAHPDLDAEHVIKPSSQFSDFANSQPYDVFQTAMEEISLDGDTSGNVTPLTAYMPPSLYWDMKRNDNLESRFTAVQQTIDSPEELASVLTVPEVQTLHTETARVNGNGEPLDEQGNIVPVDEAVADNVLAPYDHTNDQVNRNIVIGHFGMDSGVMPWYTDRLAAHIGSAPSGMWDVDTNLGMLVQGWTEHDPAISWRKIAQEVGLHLFRPDNYAVIQDV